MSDKLEHATSHDGLPARQRWTTPTVVPVPVSESEGSTFSLSNVDGTSSTS